MGAIIGGQLHMYIYVPTGAWIMRPSFRQQFVEQTTVLGFQTPGLGLLRPTGRHTRKPRARCCSLRASWAQVVWTSQALHTNLGDFEIAAVTLGRHQAGTVPFCQECRIVTSTTCNRGPEKQGHEKHKLLEFLGQQAPSILLHEDHSSYSSSSVRENRSNYIFVRLPLSPIKYLNCQLPSLSWQIWGILQMLAAVVLISRHQRPPSFLNPP